LISGSRNGVGYTKNGGMSCLVAATCVFRSGGKVAKWQEWPEMARVGKQRGADSITKFPVSF